MAQTDTEGRFAGFFGIVNGVQRIFGGRIRIARAVAEEEAVRIPGLQFVNIITFGRENPQRTATLYKIVDNALFDAVIKGRHFKGAVAVDGQIGRASCRESLYRFVPEVR